MASMAPWSPDELGVLERHIGRGGWLARVAALLPTRSESAIKAQMSHLRRRLELGDGRADRWCNSDAYDRKRLEDAEIGSRMLAEAIKRVGLRP